MANDLLLGLILNLDTTFIPIRLCDISIGFNGENRVKTKLPPLLYLV